VGANRHGRCETNGDIMPIRIETTLLDLVITMTDLTDDENELLATVLHLVNSGKVVLRGNFAGRAIPVC